MSKKNHQIKCLVWDLDNTLWNGTLLEDKSVEINEGLITLIKELDKRGVLHSVASKNNHEEAMSQLESFGLADYFLYPQINWEPKSISISQIAKNLNIGIDALAFIDDQRFELDEVAFAHPDVLPIFAGDVHKILEMPAFMPRFVTEDSKFRRKMYQSDIIRNKLEEISGGSAEDFLRTLEMKLVISEATENDLQRAEELTVRTNQLNTTGYTYSYEELNDFRLSKSHKLLIASLEDKYGAYGKIGLTLIEIGKNEWFIKLLLMSCRVMSRGVGNMMINHLRHNARQAGVKLKAEFISNDRNRMMYMTYKFSNFFEVEKNDGRIILENNLESIPNYPEYVELCAEPIS